MTTRYRYARFKAPRHISLVHDNDNHVPDTTPRGPCPVGKLTDEQLAMLEDRYVKGGITVGPYYTLQEIRRELLRRATDGFNGSEVVSHIMALAAASRDYLTTYGDLHSRLWVNEPFIGHHSVRQTMKALGAAILYCVESGLPCMTALVVDAGDRRLSDRATHNIYNEMKKLGQDVGANVEDYVLEQTLAAMDVVAKSQQPVAA
jgi:hypothetical protein